MEIRRLEKIVDVLGLDGNLVGAAREVRIRRPDQRLVVPRNREENATIPDRVQDHGVTVSDALARHHDVNAFRRAKNRWRGRIIERPDAIEPRTRRVHDAPGRDAQRAASVDVAKTRSRNSPVAFLERFQSDVVQAHGAGMLRGQNRLEDETRIVGDAVVVERPADESLGAQLRLEPKRSRRVIAPVPADVSERGEQIVGEKPRAELPQADGALAEDREEERQRANQVRRQTAAQEIPLARRLEHEPDVTVLQIPNAAVDELRRAAARPGGEIALVDEGRTEAPKRRLARDARAVDAAANDDDVEGVGAETGKLRASGGGGVHEISGCRGDGAPGAGRARPSDDGRPHRKILRGARP